MLAVRVLRITISIDSPALLLSALSLSHRTTCKGDDGGSGGSRGPVRTNTCSIGEAALSALHSAGTDIERTEQTFETQTAKKKTWRDQNAQPTMDMTTPHRAGPAATYLASSFWEDIMQQTSELRFVLDSRVENERQGARYSSAFATSYIGSESLDTPNLPQSFPEMSISMQTRRSLCEIYLRNVDPVFKILHRPSLRAFLVEDQPYLDYEAGHMAPATLASAVYYAAVCTIEDSQCRSLFGLDKKSVSANLQRGTEAALLKSDFMTTNDLTVLQAYVLSMLAARSQDQTRRVWTMLAMGLRVGQALCLHLAEPPFQISVFEQQMRRRLWQAIGLLDLAASLDRASEPMMQSAWLDSHPPANINDEAIYFGMEAPIQEPPEGTFTDMTHPLILAAAQSVARMLAFRDFIEPGKKTIALRHQILKDFQQRVSTLLSGCKPDLFPFQLYAKRTAATINGVLQLLCLRPLQRHQNFIPPHVPGEDLLRLAADNLQKLHESDSDPATASWMWFDYLWVPWHGLAVVLAELCVCKDPETLLKYWPVVEQVYHQSSYVIAESKNGMLWKPLKKLMNQAKARKRELLGSQSSGEAIPQVPSRVDSINSTLKQSVSQPDREQLNPTPTTTTIAMGLEPTVAAGSTVNPAITLPQTSLSLDMLESYSNGWDAIDFSATSLPGPGDNDSWHNYDSFIGDVYGNCDPFLRADW
ncbi:hypothetical protein N7474_001584 [Penicillium riverlandense]|uniref:uncharacterized protein n=1 Tax=Penicillium riverlandense TaxID=1903569 RepID=UPI002547AE78|nr:uncharacterized protein N7474_001584 [Penicillium riverlandense]KAJ5833273.1 hypothetical protein N7474_001584 [Penicillium riverlandense]